MKKGKFFKRASLVGLSAVMAAGVALTAAGCGGDGGGSAGGNSYITGTPGNEYSKRADTICVWIFCNSADANTNRSICNAWMDKYNREHNTQYKVQFTNETNKGDYFTNLSNAWTSNTVPDIIYLSPRYVRSYAEAGRVLNLADYVETVSGDPEVKAEDIASTNAAKFQDIWTNALSYYGYRRGDKTAYTMGQTITYKSEGATGAGFYTADDKETGLYGLPKDYSNFSTGYNKIFFTDTIKQNVTTLKANTTRTVTAPDGDGDNDFTHTLTYTGATGKPQVGKNAPVISYATDVDYTNPYTNEHVTASAGDVAPIINIGVPTRYKPFNFFRYADFNTAYNNGDPVATLVEEYTNGEGYVVTIPGFPDETFEVTTNQDPNAPYDTTMGHIVYTYAEYSALLWAMSYYLNTFAWDNGQQGPSGNGGKYRVNAAGTPSWEVIYAGEQYDGTDGTPLYLLPWLYANDADVIDATSRYNADGDISATPTITDASAWKAAASSKSNTVKKMNLDGTYRNVDVQYGYNSQSFIETYGAFVGLGSDWNGNTAGDTEDEHSTNGWTYFRQGKCIFYGAGTWDSSTRNESAQKEFQFGQMPSPVAEKYALYSKVKDANYVMTEYSNGATAKGTGDAAANDGVQRSNPSDGCVVYEKDDIIANQLLRQDKWAARMDSVGYAVNGQVANYTGEHAWKKEAAVSLAMALTVEKDAQTVLTYSGAQLPNFVSQTKDFLNYNKGDTVTNGTFKDMLTPEGFADTASETAGAEIWNYYYQLAEAMAAASLSSATSGQTVEAYLTSYVQSHPLPAGETKIRYDESFKGDALSTFTGPEKTNVSYSMKVLRMFPFNRADRDLNLRMQYGLNAVRDSSMYTYKATWMGFIDARSNAEMLGYQTTPQLNASARTTNLKGMVRQNPAGAGGAYITPAVHCFGIAQQARQDLIDIVNEEIRLLGR